VNTGLTQLGVVDSQCSTKPGGGAPSRRKDGYFDPFASEYRHGSNTDLTCGKVGG
jgi:hypothetical protein